MYGSIYSGEKERCPICGGKLVDNKRDAVQCPEHPQCRATQFQVQFPGFHRRYRSYERASQVLNGLRYKLTENTYDPRDYKKDNPLGFTTYSDAYLKHQEGKKSYRQIKLHLSYAQAHFGNRNVKEIGFGDFEDFLLQLPRNLSGKSRHNIMATVHAFFGWVARREKKKGPGFTMPEFPAVKFQLRWRRILDKPTQWQVLEEIKRQTWHFDQKLYMACLWVASFPNVRPGELIRVKEGDFDLENATLQVNENKERKPKLVLLLPQDIDWLKTLPRALDKGLPFFRHPKGLSGVKAGSPYGVDYLYTWWRRACENLGIEGVSLYPGTKHSSLSDLNRRFGYGAAKAASGHATNKALDRYLPDDPEKLRDLYAQARGVPLVCETAPSKTSQVVEFPKK